MSKFLKNIPNIISLIRIALVFVFAFLILNKQYIGGFIVYAVAFVSDLLDGFLARKFNWVSDIGKLLDPFADKLMLVTAFVCFLINGLIPIWVLVFVATKEIAMCISAFILYKRGVVVESNVMGKASTGVWALAVAAHIFAAFIPGLSLAADILTIVAIVFALCASVSYAIRYLIKRAREQA